MAAEEEPRFAYGSAARHALVDVVGDLSLLGGRGQTGLLCGHVVAYNPDHVLTSKFLKAVEAAIDDGTVAPFPFMLTDEEDMALVNMFEEKDLGAESRAKWLAETLQAADMPTWYGSGRAAPWAERADEAWLRAPRVEVFEPDAPPLARPRKWADPKRVQPPQYVLSKEEEEALREAGQDVPRAGQPVGGPGAPAPGSAPAGDQ